MDSYNSIEHAHSDWLDYYRAVATSCFGPCSVRTYVFGYESSTDEEQTVLATLLLPVGSCEAMLSMSMHSQYVDDVDVEAGGFLLGDKTFSLSSLLEGYPMRDGCFTDTTAGRRAGRGWSMDSNIMAHVAYAGLIIMLMDACRDKLWPLATADDILRLSRGMLLAFEE